MELSERTTKILKNFSTINQSIVFNTGNVIRTISPLKTIMAQATVNENFPFEFGIYDLNQFLGVVSLFKTPEFDFNEKYVTIQSNSASSNYFFTDKSMIETPPAKTLDMATRLVGFSMTSEEIKSLLQAASVLSLPEIVITGDGKEIKITASNVKNSSNHNFTRVVGETFASFKFIIKVDNLKMLPHGYDVALTNTPANMVEFSSQDDNIKYWVAAEQDSVYDGE